MVVLQRMCTYGRYVEMCLCFVTSFLELSHLNPSLFLSSPSHRKVEVLKLALLPLDQDGESLIQSLVIKKDGRWQTCLHSLVFLHSNRQVTLVVFRWTGLYLYGSACACSSCHYDCEKDISFRGKNPQSQWLYFKCHSAFWSPEDLSSSATLKY